MFLVSLPNRYSQLNLDVSYYSPPQLAGGRIEPQKAIKEAKMSISDKGSGRNISTPDKSNKNWLTGSQSREISRELKGQDQLTLFQILVDYWSAVLSHQ